MLLQTKQGSISLCASSFLVLAGIATLRCHISPPSSRNQESSSHEKHYREEQEEEGRRGERGKEYVSMANTVLLHPLSLHMVLLSYVRPSASASAGHWYYNPLYFLNQKGAPSFSPLCSFALSCTSLSCQVYRR